MKSSRALHLILALTAMLLASLACSLAGSPAATQEKPEATSAAVTSPDPTEIPKPELGEVVLDESFTDNSNNWYVGKDADTEVALEDGKYKVRVLTLDNFYWFTPPVSVSNVDMTVDTEFTEGAPENAAYGFLCNFKDADNHYRVRIGPDGTYSIDKRVNGGDAVSIVDWTHSSAIKAGIGVTNKIRAICNDSHITLYANDALLADVIDSSLSGGSFQLMAGGYGNSKSDKNPVGVNFSNLTVRKTLAWEHPTENMLTDTFDDNKNDWDIFKEDKASVQIENGQLVMKVNEAESSYLTYSGLSLSDVDMTFDATIQEGTPANSAYGAACRRTNTDNRYMFDISGDGSYTLNKRIDGNLETIIDWSSSNAIKTGAGETNRVHIICSGENLELYVNDQLLVSAQDTSITGGTFTLQAGRFKVDTEPVTVAFDNLEAKYPEK
jgi:hypothetical protein